MDQLIKKDYVNAQIKNLSKNQYCKKRVIF